MEILVSSISFLLFGILFYLTERRFPLHNGRWHDNVSLDIVGLGVVIVMSMVISYTVGLVCGNMDPFRISSVELTPVARGALFLILSDLSRYLAHFMMHKSYLWPTHRFHHSSQVLYWFSGMRASAIHMLFFSVPTAFLVWILNVDVIYLWINVALVVFWNGFMHINLRIDDRLQTFLEYFISTPRYHYLHHSTDITIRDRNLASIFTIWDRIFGTYVSPTQVDQNKLVFGLEPTDRPPTWRMVLGI